MDWMEAKTKKTGERKPGRSQREEEMGKGKRKWSEREGVRVRQRREREEKDWKRRTYKVKGTLF